MVPVTTEGNRAAVFDKTYRLDWERGRIVGLVDGLEAVKQAVHLILATERYQYPVYSWDYGTELWELYGKPAPYLLPELKRRITEALLTDDRVQSVDDFAFQQEKGKVLVSFTVHTALGELKLKKEVDNRV